MGLDVSEDAANWSSKIIRCLGLEKEIEIVRGDETLLRELDWDMVLVAAMADPKARIFNNLRLIMREKGQTETLVFFRTYTGMRAILHVPVTEDDIKGFRVVKTFYPVGRVNNTIVAAQLEE